MPVYTDNKDTRTKFRYVQLSTLNFNSLLTAETDNHLGKCLTLGLELHSFFQDIMRFLKPSSLKDNNLEIRRILSVTEIE